jgi:hypothetical protein
MMFFKKQFDFAVKVLTFVLLGSFAFSNVLTMPAFAHGATGDPVKKSALRKYATDLTELARAGRLGENVRYKREVNQLVEALANGGVRQPVLLDEAGEYQTLVVESLAARIAAGDVPANLKDKRVLQLELDSLFSNSKDKAETSQIVADVIAELADSKSEVILFVDELANFVGSAQINNALAEVLLQGKARIIGGSSQIAYNERIENSAELAAIFQPITIADVNLNTEDIEQKNSVENPLGYRGDTVSPDLREMMANDTTGEKRVNVIVQAKDADNRILREMMARNQIRLEERIGDSNTLIVNLPLSAVQTLASSGIVNYMSPDREMKLTGHLENTTGAAAMRSQPAFNGRSSYALDGKGIGIAVLDSGITTNHRAFTDASSGSRVVYSKNFTTDATAEDNFGHGTHVAAIAAGSAQRDSHAYKGIASKADIINLKVLADNGLGRTAWLLNALDWIIDNRAAYNIKVVNLSLGGPAIDTYTNDPVCVKVRQLSTLGITVVAAAGNEGKNYDTGEKLYGHIHSPGNDPTVFDRRRLEYARDGQPRRRFAGDFQFARSDALVLHPLERSANSRQHYQTRPGCARQSNHFGEIEIRLFAGDPESEFVHPGA